MFTAFFSSSFETPDIWTVFQLAQFAIIVVVKARTGVVFAPQATEHGTFSSLLENTYSIPAPDMTCTRGHQQSVNLFSLFFLNQLFDTVNQHTKTYLSANTNQQVEIKLKLNSNKNTYQVRCLCAIQFLYVCMSVC